MKFRKELVEGFNLNDKNLVRREEALCAGFVQPFCPICCLFANWDAEAG